MVVRDTAFLQLFDTGSTVLPLFPHNGSKPLDDQIVDGSKSGGYVCMTVVVPPAAGILVEPGDHLLDAQAAAAPGELLHALFEPFDGF